jgi:hypothetical protein
LLVNVVTIVDGAGEGRLIAQQLETKSRGRFSVGVTEGHPISTQSGAANQSPLTRDAGWRTCGNIYNATFSTPLIRH